MERDFALGRARAMFEKEDALPSSKQRSSKANRDRKLSLGECGLEMRGHVVGTFVVMLVGEVLGSEPVEEVLEVSSSSGRRIFLDQE
jgi:hypothetical protein